MIDLADRRKRILQIVTEGLFPGQGELYPFALLVQEDGREIMVDLHMCMNDKDGAAATIKEMVREHKPVMVAMCIEAWTIQTEPRSGTPPSEAEAIEEVRAEMALVEGNLENHPQREEIVSIAFETPTHTWHHVYPIIRDGHSVTLGEPKVHESKITGRFTNFWDQDQTERMN